MDGWRDFSGISLTSIVLTNRDSRSVVLSSFLDMDRRDADSFYACNSDEKEKGAVFLFVVVDDGLVMQVVESRANFPAGTGMYVTSQRISAYRPAPLPTAPLSTRPPFIVHLPWFMLTGASVHTSICLFKLDGLPTRTPCPPTDLYASTCSNSLFKPLRGVCHHAAALVFVTVAAVVKVLLRPQVLSVQVSVRKFFVQHGYDLPGVRARHGSRRL